MGAYTRAAVDHYIGSYLTLRPSFSQPGAIVAYRTDITWDPEWPSLLFQERDRPDAPYSHRGRLYIPASSMFIHLVSLTKGAMRMVVVSQVDRFGEMRGIITTLHKHGAMLVPVATPIVYAKRESFDGPFGTIGTDSPAYKGYRPRSTTRSRRATRALSGCDPGASPLLPARSLRPTQRARVAEEIPSQSARTGSRALWYKSTQSRSLLRPGFAFLQRLLLGLFLLVGLVGGLLLLRSAGGLGVFGVGGRDSDQNEGGCEQGLHRLRLLRR